VRGRMRPLQAPQDCPQEVVDLAADCMEADPQARPTAQQLVQRLLAVPGPSPGKQQEQQLPREKAQREQREQQRQQAASWGATPRPPRPARQPFTAPAGTPVVLVAQGGELRRRHSDSLPLPGCCGWQRSDRRGAGAARCAGPRAATQASIGFSRAQPKPTCVLAAAARCPRRLVWPGHVLSRAALCCPARPLPVCMTSHGEMLRGGGGSAAAAWRPMIFRAVSCFAASPLFSSPTASLSCALQFCHTRYLIPAL
jgi:hypothetical protein